MRFDEKQKVDHYRAFYYAAASGDFNPLHIDPAVGERAGFGGPILHGLCTAAWMVDSVTRAHGDPRKIKSMSCRFSGPVRLGDELSFTGAVREQADGQTTYTVDVKNQDDDQILRKALVTMED